MNTLSAPLKQGQTIGILGAGQLARMLCESAHRLGFKTLIFCKENSEPAAQVSPYTSDWKDFKSQIDVATFESEFFKSDVLQKQLPDHRFFPSLDCLENIQFRHSQKKLLLESKIPTAKYLSITSLKDLQDFFSSQGKCVIKTNFGGYDGFGTFVIKDQNQFDSFLLKNSQLLIQPQVAPAFIAEAFIDFKRELAISVARDQYGNKVFLPLVETLQKDNKCDLVQGPIQHKKIVPLKKSISKFVDRLNYVGVMAFELFDTGSELLVNELAPRVHNSAHYSQLALSDSQFDLHIQSVAGLRLKKHVDLLSPFFAMANLVGSGNHQLSVDQPYPSGLYLYGKNENRIGRKMGHINAVGKTKSEALKKAKQARKKVTL